MNDTIRRRAVIDAWKNDFKEYINALDMPKDDYNGIMEYIDELPSVQQWIPCSEVPDTDRNVFIARGDSNMMTVCVGHYRHDYKQWYEDRNWFAKCLYDGLYWCEIPPLPEPWEGGQDESDD